MVEKPLYKRVPNKKGSFCYKKIMYHEFPQQPSEGVWLVMKKPGVRSYECITHISGLPNEQNLPTKLVLSKYKNELCKIFMQSGKSAHDIVTEMIDFIANLSVSNEEHI